MTDPKAGANGEPGAAGAARGGATKGTDETVRYLVAARPLPAASAAIGPLDIDRLAELLAAEPGVRVLDRIADTGPEAAARAPVGCPPVLVVTAPAAVASRWMTSPQLIVEPDAPLAYTHPNPIASAFTAPDPAVLVAAAEEEKITVVVRGPDDEPVPGAAVYLLGTAWPAAATTNADGRATLRMPAGGTVTGLWVRPRFGYWPVAVDRPQLSTRADNLIAATPLEATFDGFPKRKAVSWAVQALRLHEIAPTLRGHGVKLALVDSGVADTHPELDGQVTRGFDAISGDENGWASDVLGHGTACAGIISAADDDLGIDGVAVDAEVHVLKVMPGGRISHLLKALDHCIREQVDVAQLSVGTLGASELVALKIADARAAGVLCVAPAGNTSSGPVTFPASLPTVLAVGAVGRAGTFPPDSHRPADLGPADRDGLFVPGFTAAGPEVDVCAPGVAVISTVPPDGYAVLDGTGIAAAYITALAGLVLAHHDDFRARYPRGPARVDRLAQLISASCRPVAALGSRTGAGMPDARSALAAIEPILLDWSSLMFGQMRLDLARAGLVGMPPAGPQHGPQHGPPGWPTDWPNQ